MADLDEMRLKIEAASKSVQEIGKDLAESNKFAGTFVETMSNLAGIGSKGGAIWSTIGRFSAGTGLFDIQNRVRSLTVFFRLIFNIEKQRAEEMKEINAAMSKQGTFLKNFLVTYNSVDSIQKSTNEKYAKAILYQETINKLRIREMGFADYLNDSKKNAIRGISEQLHMERELIDTQKARANLSDESKGILGDKFKTGFFGDPEIESRVVQLLNISEEIADMENLVGSLEGEEKETMQGRIKDSQTMFEILKGELGDKGINVASGFGPFSGKVLDITKSPTESFFKRLTGDPKGTIKKLFLPSAELLNFIKRVAIFKILKKNLQLFGRIAILLLPLLGKAALAFGMLGLIVYLLHQSGFIENAMEFFKSIKWKDTADALMGLLTGIFDIVVGFFQLFHALFTGGSFMDEVVPAIKRILGLDGEKGGGFAGVVRGIFEGLLQGAITLLVGTILSVGAGIIGSIYDTAVEAKDSAAKFLGFIGGSAAGGYGGAQIGAAIGTAILPGVGTAVGGVLGAGIGAAIGGDIGSGLGGGVANLLGLANGGTVTSGGMFLVGERGPELVNLPAGSAVFNNSQTRRMGNIINVSVNGRVGASDAELDDIARKIGQKINLEINRYNNAGYRV